MLLSLCVQQYFLLKDFVSWEICQSLFFFISLRGVWCTLLIFIFFDCIWQIVLSCYSVPQTIRAVECIVVVIMLQGFCSQIVLLVAPCGKKKQSLTQRGHLHSSWFGLSAGQCIYICNLGQTQSSKKNFNASFLSSMPCSKWTLTRLTFKTTSNNEQWNARRTQP